MAVNIAKEVERAMAVNIGSVTIEGSKAEGVTKTKEDVSDIGSMRIAKNYSCFLLVLVCFGKMYSSFFKLKVKTD